MKSFFILFAFFAILFVGCKKETTCPNIEGKWLLTAIYQDNIKIEIPDTVLISETLEISANYKFISSSTKTGKIWNTGTFDCAKVFDADALIFKKGSKSYYNFYARR